MAAQDSQKNVAWILLLGGIGLSWAALTGRGFLNLSRGLIHGQTPSSVPPSQQITVQEPTSQLPGGTSGGTGGATSPKGPGENAFFTAVLTTMLAPPSKANLDSLHAWRLHESTWPPGAKNNPLNTTQPEPGSTVFNSVSVQNYPTAIVGVMATAHTILNGRYPLIAAALRSGKGVCGNGFGSEFQTWSGEYSSVC